MYKVYPAAEAEKDLINLASYMKHSLKNEKAASNFIKHYYKQVENLIVFPFAYRSLDFEYEGYWIRHKIFLSYNMFFVIDEKHNLIIILRILKNRQNWKAILHNICNLVF